MFIGAPSSTTSKERLQIRSRALSPLRLGIVGQPEEPSRALNVNERNILYISISSAATTKGGRSRPMLGKSCGVGLLGSLDLLTLTYSTRRAPKHLLRRQHSHASRQRSVKRLVLGHLLGNLGNQALPKFPSCRDVRQVAGIPLTRPYTCAFLMA